MIRLVFNVPSRLSNLSSIAAKRRWIDTSGSALGAIKQWWFFTETMHIVTHCLRYKGLIQEFSFFLNSLTKNNSIWISNPHKLRARIQSVVCKGLFWFLKTGLDYSVSNLMNSFSVYSVWKKRFWFFFKHRTCRGGESTKLVDIWKRSILELC